MSKRSNILLPFVAGMAAGAALGMLFAPRSGKETRAAIKDGATKARNTLEDLVAEGRGTWDKVRKEGTKSADDAGDLLRFLVSEGRDLLDRIRTGHEQPTDR
ncbi:MAG: YtxH domain-containing protein [Flavobacteriales bacterium]